MLFDEEPIGNGYSAYCLFIALKLHFSGTYDFFKYGGKTKTSKESFMTNPSRYVFYKLSRKYSIEELKGFFVANLLRNPNPWGGSLNDPEADEIYTNWLKKIQSLTYNFTQEVSDVMESVEDKESLIKVVDGQHPLLLTMAFQGKVSIETLIIMNDIMGNFMEMWGKKISEDIIYPLYHTKCQKYSPFLVYDKPKMRTILKEKVVEYG